MMKKLYFLFTIMLCGVMPIIAQNTDDSRNKAVFQSTDGNNEVNTDDIQVIRFDGGKVTVVQPWGETVFDHTLQNLSFSRPQSGTLRLTVDANIDTSDDTNRAFSIDGNSRLVSTWESGDVVYVYANDVSTTSIGTLTPATTGSSSARLVGNINATGLSDNQTLSLETQPRTYSFASQTGALSNLFYAKATATVSIDGGNATISNATFTRPMAVVKFTLKDKATTYAIEASPLIIKIGETTYTVTPTSAASEIYFAIPEFSDKDITLTATVGTDTYTYNKTGVTFENGKYYAIAVNMVRIPIAADIGKIIATDGRIYDVNAPLPSLVTPVAMIAYIGNASECAHGLAIALSDDTSASFTTAGTNAANHTPTAPILGGTWRIPSKTDWENMFLACRKDGDASSAASDMTNAGFREKLTACSANVTTYEKYWTSTTSEGEYGYCIYVGSDTSASIQSTLKINTLKARAVLAF
ncbi:MAG: hypothetical protein J6T05_07520 [Prevotella sp.]|nr:hypothetical protein [Prevotella sp.]